MQICTAVERGGKEGGKSIERQEVRTFRAYVIASPTRLPLIWS